MGKTGTNKLHVTSAAAIHGWLLLSGFVIFVTMLVLVSYINTGRVFLFEPIDWHGILREGWLIWIQLTAVLYFVYYAVRFFDRRYSNTGFSIVRYVYELTLVILGGFLLNKLFHLFFIWFIVVPEEDIAGLERKLKNLLVVTQALVVVMYGFMTAFRIFSNLQKKQLEILLWQKEVATTQFEALKNQLNPHFLFNSLSVLTSLVYMDAVKAEAFIEKLSKTYRYLLDQREKEAVLLSQEMDFLHNFRFLVEQRYGSKLQITDNIHSHEVLYLLPHTLLVLMEYIIGSSGMSAANPLHVDVSLKGRNLLIQYQHRPRTAVSHHQEQQYNSLIERYRQMNLVVSKTLNELTQEITIRIPLLHQHD